MHRNIVSKRATRVIESPWYPEDLLPRLQETLAALADIECRFDALTEQIETAPRSAAAKLRLREELEKQRHDETQPLHCRLSHLHYRMMRLAVAQDLLLTG